MARRGLRTPNDPFVNWPAGWEAEAQRLAAHYERTANGVVEFEGDVLRWRQNAVNLRRVSQALSQAAQGMRDLAEDRGLAPLTHAVFAYQTRYATAPTNVVDLDGFAAYCHQLTSLEVLARSAAQDFDDAVMVLDERCRSPRGNQTTLVLRFTIHAAASAYTRLFGVRPGSSRSDSGPFGRFVREIIRRVPAQVRPKPLSPAALSDTVEAWRRRQPVAN